MKKYLAITGGIGGAKLALGLSKLLTADELCFVVNTGDDFEHLGYHISPDLDTLTYTLAGMSNREVGWGRANETWNFMEALDQLGGETWFQLGDKDLALHSLRRELLNKGATLTGATREITQALGIAHDLFPMSDEPVRTIVHTVEQGKLAFQHYFVRERCAPSVTGFEFDGIASARVNPNLIAVLRDCAGVIICPSNPFVSVDPILSIPGMRTAISTSGVPVVAVSPIVSGLAIKGPAAKMMAEMHIPNTAVSVAEHYGDLLTGFVLDEQDSALADAIDLPTLATPSIMKSLDERRALAARVLEFIGTLG